MAAGIRDDVGYQDLRSYLQRLEEAGLLKHIQAEVDWKFEIGAISGLGIDRKQPGMLLENVKDYPGRPLAINLMYSLEELAVAFNCEPDAEKIQAILVEGLQNRLPSVIMEDGPCKEKKHFGDDVDLYSIPVPWWHEGDGGRYLATQAGCITRHPETGVLNCGTYKCMIVDKNTLTLTSGITRVGHIRPNEAKDEPTPILLAIGMDPLLTLASGTPVPVDEHGHMEFEAAGAWRGTPTVLVKAETSDLLAPAYAEYIIEGEVVPKKRIAEGPHGESTGFYGSRLQAYEIKVKAITHRTDPINYGLICRQFEDYPRWLFRSASFMYQLIDKTGFDNIKEVYFPDFVGWGWGFGIIRADVSEPDQVKQIIEAAWELQPQRWMIVVDEDCNALDMNEVLWRMICCVEPAQHVFYGPITDPEIEDPEKVDKPVPTQPLGFDATFKSKGIKFAPINTFSRELRSRVNARWREFGLTM